VAKIIAGSGPYGENGGKSKCGMPLAAADDGYLGRPSLSYPTITMHLLP